MAIASSARSGVLQLRWQAHNSSDQEQPDPRLDGSLAPPPGAPEADARRVDVPGGIFF